MSKQKTLGVGLEKRVVERARAKGLDAKVQPGSGVYRDFPSDCEIARTLIECKVRAAEMDAEGHRTFRVDMEWWKKVKENSGAGYNGAALVMNAKYSPGPMVLIDLDFFLDLLKRSQGSHAVESMAERVLGEIGQLSIEDLRNPQGQQQLLPVMPDEIQGE